MDNDHNPIARIIAELQKRWIDSTGQTEEYRLVCWLVDPEEQALINGFYKLESSQCGRVPDVFVVMLSPFTSQASYSRQLVADIADMWRQDSAVKSAGVEWDTQPFIDRIERGENPDDVLASMLTGFHKDVCKKDQALIFGMVPQTVDSISEYNDWLIAMSGKLPSEVKLSVVDHIGKNYFKPLCKHLDEAAVVIKCGDLGLQDAVNRIARGGGGTA